MRTVKTMRGDDFLEDRRDPDLIRMDVEGHELEVLKGFERTFQELDDIAVFVEIHEELLGAEGVEQLFEFMDSKGFDSSQDMDKFLEENKTHVYFTKSAQ